MVRPLARIVEGSSSTSVTWVSLEGRHRPLVSHRSTRLYYVLSGSLQFVVGGEDPVAVGADELLVIPRGVVYRFAGTGTYLVINTPRFEEGDDHYVE
ncbi:MAG: cupin domain-containing protein [Acidimicrobiales bacterium]